MPATPHAALLLWAAKVGRTRAWCARLKNLGDRHRCIARLCILGAVCFIFTS
jgi:uncharacterized protein (DUF486 family)